MRHPVTVLPPTATTTEIVNAATIAAALIPTVAGRRDAVKVEA
jgi:hypothetical protein